MVWQTFNFVLGVLEWRGRWFRGPGRQENRENIQN